MSIMILGGRRIAMRDVRDGDISIDWPASSVEQDLWTEMKVILNS